MKRDIVVALIVVLAIVGSLTQADEPRRIRELEITDTDRDHWAFRPIVAPPAPRVNDGDGVRNPIDRFIRAKLDSAGIAPMPEAGRATLIRRLSFGLTGLPPAPEDVDAFVNDTSPDACEKLVDRLLASPAYGERWAQHWLDLARFAETDGFERDKVRKEAWRYRDWVIGAFNRDLPYDKFVRLQIAGDEISPDPNGTHVATGFLVSGPDMPDLNLPDERRHMLLNEMASTVASVFMGLTLECAQCHNHRHDAISQADFYRFRALFANSFPKLGRDKQMPPSVREAGANAPDTKLMIRGDFRQPGDALEPAFLRIANAGGRVIAKPGPEAKSSMRRRALAEWLTRPDHPLTARVIANRVWMHHFGKGLSNTPSDFGVMGEAPSHPELLDWLATELVRTNWSLKKLHKLIVTSATYRQASRPADPSWTEDLRRQATQRWKLAKEKDRDNRLLSRMNRVRLDGEAIRDAMLAAGQRLSQRRGGAGVRPPLPKELLDALLKGQWEVSPDEEDHRRRSVYLFVRRNLRFPIFEAFDRPDGNASCGRRPKSTTAPQALILLNSDMSRALAQAVAVNATATADAEPEQVRLCFQQILSREPTASELKTGRAFLAEQANRVAAEGPRGAVARHAALADLCLALFNTNESVYVD